jgi:Lon protease-like protein
LELPLFPLNTVLFPGMALPLNIFEPRYRQMIGECLERDSEFGVVLIREGREVGAPATPFMVGTTARITEHQRLEDGRMAIATVGGRRFRIERLLPPAPYLRGEVSFLESHAPAGPHLLAAAERTGGLFTEFLHFQLSLSDQWTRRVQLPGSPEELSDYVAVRLQVDNGLKQQLLEELDVADRLTLEAGILEFATETLAEQVRMHRRLKWAGLGALS